MSFDFSNLRLQKVILHNVFPPSQDGVTAPELSNELTVLGIEGLRILQERIIFALGKGSHNVEMEISQIDETSCFNQVCRLLELDELNFIRDSQLWPGSIPMSILIGIGLGAH